MFADGLRIGFERLVRREYVVVGADDAEVGVASPASRAFVGVAAGGEGVGEVAAGQALRSGPRDAASSMPCR